jgi:organic radical activating enzyme
MSADITHNSKFCVRPFVHSLVETNGKFRPCCRAIPLTDFTGRTEYNINTDTAEDWWQSPYMNYLRLNMLAGNNLVECERCDRQESAGATSFRQHSNKQFGKVTQADDMPRDWEFQITNLCNLKCMMCSSQNSSQLLNENVILFRAPDTQQQYQWNEQSHAAIKELFKTLDSVVLRGGEPFMVPQIKELLTSIPQERAKDIVLLINTNLTKFTPEWAKILSKFKHVKFSCSIDAVEDLNHYIRFPSEWSTVEHAVKMAKLMPNANVFVNTCVQNLNVLHLDKLLLWANQRKVHVVLDALTEPELFEISNLPNELALKAMARLSAVKPNLDLNMITGFDGIVDILYNASYSETKWIEMVKVVTKRDQHRGVDVLTVNPEFKDYWYAT